MFDALNSAEHPMGSEFRGPPGVDGPHLARARTAPACHRFDV